MILQVVESNVAVLPASWGSPPKSALPQSAADHGYRWAAAHVFLWSKAPTQRGLHAQDVQEIGGNARGFQSFRLSGAGKRHIVGTSVGAESIE